MSAQEPKDLKLGKPLKVEGQSVDTELTEPETAALNVEATPLNTQDALDRLAQLQELVKTQHDTLMAKRSSHKLEFDQAREWLGKLDGVEANLVRLNMMIDAVSKEIRAVDKMEAEQTKPVSAKHTQQLEAARAQASDKMRQLEPAGTQLLEMIVQLEQETQQHRGVETEASDEYRIEVAGAMKTLWRGSNEFNEGRLGKFGQDVMLIDRSKRIGVVADGTSGLKDSYEISRRVAQTAESLLQNIDENEFTLEEIKFLLQGEIDEILANLDAAGQELNGSCAVLAVRYLEKFDAVVMIDLGDCEGVLSVGSKIISIKNRIPESTTLDYAFKKISGKPAMVENPGLLDVVHTVSLTELRKRYPDMPIHLLLSTDGLKNNSGKRLQDQAQTVIDHGVQATVQQFEKRKDDITIIDMDLSLPAVAQQQAAG
ncbi:MAG: hypothetical protein HY565_00015 [Candidatus Kerfeldbacteria bacterium]|nr:hypothetical protein [Candidatus Kerfeldbacteria bacterium]